MECTAARADVVSTSASSQGLAIPAKSVLPPRPPSVSRPFVGSAPAFSGVQAIPQSSFTCTLPSGPFVSPTVSFPRPLTIPSHPQSFSTSTVQQPHGTPNGASGVPFLAPTHVNVKLSQGQASQLAMLQRMSAGMLLACQSSGASPSSHSSALTSMPLFGTSPNSASPTAFANLSLGSSPSFGPSPNGFHSTASFFQNGSASSTELSSSLPPAPGLLSSSLGSAPTPTSSSMTSNFAPAIPGVSGAGQQPAPPAASAFAAKGLSDVAIPAAATGQPNMAVASHAASATPVGNATSLRIAPLDTGLQHAVSGASPPNSAAAAASGSSPAAINGLPAGHAIPGRPSPLGQPNGNSQLNGHGHHLDVPAGQPTAKSGGRGSGQRSTLSSQLRKGSAGIAKIKGDHHKPGLVQSASG